MATTVGWYETDDTTPLGSLDLGSVSPGSTGSAQEIRAKNDGDQDFSAVTVEIQQAGSYDAYEYLEIATGSGSPGTYQGEASNPLNLGGITAGNAVSVWVRANVPVATDVNVGQVANLVLLGAI